MTTQAVGFAISKTTTDAVPSTMTRRTIELTADDIMEIIRQRYIGYTEGALEFRAMDLGPGFMIYVHLTVTPPAEALPELTEVESQGLASIILTGSASRLMRMTKNTLGRKGCLEREGAGQNTRHRITTTGFLALEAQYPGAIVAMRKHLS